MILIITEKPSARRNFEKALGGKTGTFNNEKYKLVNSVGHILNYSSDITKLIKDDNLKEKYKSWDIKNLPFDYNDFNFVKEISKGADGKSLKPVYEEIKKSCLDSQVDEIVIASDNDPSGEGTLLVAEILLTFWSKIKDKKITRMFFEDESEKEIQKSFINRVLISNLYFDKDYLKSDYRSKWDYLSIQFTRIATNYSGGSVLRNGRLKSFMNNLVGTRLNEIANYKKIPSYYQAFKSNTNVWFTKKDDVSYKTEKEVPIISGNNFIVQKIKEEEKRQAPPKLLDLATLSALLENQGYKSKDILKVYQKMYEDSVVSYPRTEDKIITIEQFNEMKSNIPKIARLVDVDTKLLTQSTPRKCHIGKGSHGANRPGKNVPSSLDELDSKYGKGAKQIYTLLAKSFLSILGDDYKYLQITGNIKDYEDFVGKTTIIVDFGFKQIFNTDRMNNEKSESRDLGTTAEFKVKETFPKKPETPTMKWLMKELEKYNVGTGATRTSTYADLVNEKAKYPLMKATKGKLSLTDYGKVNYILLKDTYIGSHILTEKLYEEMNTINKDTDISSLLNEMERYVLCDIETMKNNSKNIPTELLNNNSNKTFEKKEKYKGIWKDKEIEFNISYSGHTFTEEECKKLLAGEIIEIECMGKYGKYKVKGNLQEQTYKGTKFVGFNKV